MTEKGVLSYVPGSVFCNNINILDTPGYTGIHRDTPGYTGIHQDTPGYTGIHRDTPGYTGIHQDTPGYTGIHRDTPGYTRIHQDTPDTLEVRKYRIEADRKLYTKKNISMCPFVYHRKRGNQIHKMFPWFLAVILKI